MSDPNNTTPRYVFDERPPFVAVDMRFITDIAPEVGGSTTLVYLYLVKLAGSHESCFPSAQHIADKMQLSLRTVRDSIRTLRERNLVRTEKRVKEDGSQTSNNIYILPIPPIQKLPTGGKQKLHTNIDTEETDSKHTCAFDDFYAQYPKKMQKQDAIKAWSRLSNAERVQAVTHLPEYLPYFASIDKQYIPLPASWLNDKPWMDEEVPQPVHTNGHAAVPMADRDWIKQDGRVL